MEEKSIGLFGYGQFGRFFALYLAQLGAVKVYDPLVLQEQTGTGVEVVATAQEAAKSDVLVFAVPLNQLDALLTLIQDSVPASSLLFDVTSVKVTPLSILQSHFPNNQILGTHPIFGPQSGKDGIKGLPIVLCNESWGTVNDEWLKRFFADDLGLRIIEKTAEEHDREMAYVQGLSHLIGRALSEMEIPPVDSATKSYEHLLELRNLLKDDSWELFETIQNGNPSAEAVRLEFVEKINRLEKKLEEGKG